MRNRGMLGSLRLLFFVPDCELGCPAGSDRFTIVIVSWLISPTYSRGRIQPIYKPWEPITFIFRGYNPYFEGLQPSFLMGLGSKGRGYNPLILSTSRTSK